MIDLMQSQQRCSPSKKQLRSKTVRDQSCALPFTSSFRQSLQCRVMCRCRRCQCVCGVITSLVQSGGDLPGDVYLGRMPFDPHEFQSPRVLQFFGTCQESVVEVHCGLFDEDGHVFSKDSARGSIDRPLLLSPSSMREQHGFQTHVPAEVLCDTY